MPEFRWNRWNVEHIAKHAVAPAEAEYVISHARSPWPQRREDGKYLVWSQSADGRYLQVIYIFSPLEVIFVIHARELTDNEKRQYRRRRGR